jgi:hypothetical protein
MELGLFGGFLVGLLVGTVLSLIIGFMVIKAKIASITKNATELAVGAGKELAKGVIKDAAKKLASR